MQKIFKKILGVKRERFRRLSDMKPKNRGERERERREN
jgi:hypothetical protein